METQKIQLIEITPEQLKTEILSGVKSQFAEFSKNFSPKEPTEFLTRNEVRDLLKVDLSTIHNYVKRGKLKAYGIAGRVYFKRVEVESAIIPIN